MLTYDGGAIERGFTYDDEDVGIAWPQDIALLVCERDVHAPSLRESADKLPS